MSEYKENQYAPLQYIEGGMVVDKDGICFCSVFGTIEDQKEIGEMIAYRFNDYDSQRIINDQQEQEIITLRIQNEKLKDALQSASAHLDYCGYGDSWERQGTEGLEEQIKEALS